MNLGGHSKNSGRDLLIREADGFRRVQLDLETGVATNPDIRAVYDYWTALKGSRRAPCRKEIDPMAIVHQLPGILMYNIEREPLRFQYRLTGTYSDNIHGGSPKGEYVDAMKPEVFGQTLHEDFSLVVETWEPHLAELTFTNREGNMRSFQVLRMPLSDTGEIVDNIIAFATYRG